jgi:hypothetical protein
METSPIVQQEKEKFDHYLYFKSSISHAEHAFANGKFFFPATLILYLGNGLILANRFGLANNPMFGAAFLLTAVPVSICISKHLFGDEKLRRVWQNEMDKELSAKYYEENKF